MELAELGYFSKTHGIKGHLVLKYSGAFSEDVKVLFVDVNGGKAPYFISDMKEAGNNLVLSFEDFDTVEKARPLVGKKVFIDAALLEEEETEHEWLGFTLVDKQHGVLGPITEINDNGQQLILTVEHEGNEILLPLIEDFIERVDEETKTLHYQAPEGLIELYTEKGE